VLDSIDEATYGENIYKGGFEVIKLLKLVLVEISSDVRPLGFLLLKL
jgi:hypothetical protein